MLFVQAESMRAPYDRPFEGTSEGGLYSEVELECLCGLVRGHCRKVKRSVPGPLRLFEIGAHQGSGICHFQAMIPEMEIHALVVQQSQLAPVPRPMAGEVLPQAETGGYVTEGNPSYVQHFSNSRTFDWDGLAKEGKFDIVFVNGIPERFTVLADTLNALKILKEGGLVIWHGYKVTDEPGRQVFAAVNDLDVHEFQGGIHHVSGTGLAYAVRPLLSGNQALSGQDKAALLPLDVPTGLSEAGAIARHLARERKLSFARKARLLPERPLVLFFSDHRNPVWPEDIEPKDDWERYRTTRDPQLLSRADIVVFHLPQVVSWYRLPKNPNQIWAGVTMESDVYYPAQADPAIMATLDFLISYHQDADYRANYAHPGTWEEVLAAVPVKDPDKLVCAFISNEHSLSGREAIVDGMEKLLPVHHYGAWRFNATLPRPEGRAAKLAILQRYHFCLAFENSIQEDYVTEKWFDCFVAGCVPVYWGAPNVENYAPGPRSFLDLRSCRALSKLVHPMRAAALDPQFYQTFFRWKERPSQNFKRFYDAHIPCLSLLDILKEAVQKAEASL